MQGAETQTPSHLTHLGLGTCLAWNFALSVQGQERCKDMEPNLIESGLRGIFHKSNAGADRGGERSGVRCSRANRNRKHCRSRQRTGEWRSSGAGHKGERESEQVGGECCVFWMDEWVEIPLCCGLHRDTWCDQWGVKGNICPALVVLLTSLGDQQGMYREEFPKLDTRLHN